MTDEVLGSDALLDRLSRDPRPVGEHAVSGRLGAAVVTGAGVALAGVTLLLGLRADMAAAAGLGIFWIKLAYGGGLAAIGLWCLERLARPDGQVRRRIGWAWLPLAAIGGIAVLQVVSVPADQRGPLVMGTSAMMCPWLILATASPLFAALAWVLRGLAPTRLMLAGAVAGLTAGAAAAGIYALHCPESGAAFVAVWYTLGIMLAGAAGALLGPLVLRW